MKISTNSFGNYTAAAVKKSVQPNNVAAAANETGKISKEEKTFFAGMYPENKSEIMEYQFYNAKGKVSGVTLGSLFDRRG